MCCLSSKEWLGIRDVDVGTPQFWYFFVYPTLGQYLRVSVLPSAAAAAAAEGLNRFSGTGTCSEIRRDETVAVSFRWGQDPAKEYDVDDYTICP